MTDRPLVTFGDVIAEVMTLLRSRIANRQEPYAKGVAFSLDRPKTAEKLPLVQIANDLDMVTWPIVSRSTIRVSCWHTREDHANDLAQLCQAILLAHSGNTLASCRPLTGPLRGADDLTGARFASITVAAHMRATPL